MLRIRSSYNQRSASHWPVTPLPLAGSVSWDKSPCVHVGLGEVPQFYCVTLISINKLVLRYSNSPPLTSSAVGSTIMNRTILFRTETNSTSCGISTPFMWERLPGIPILIPAHSFSGVRFEADVVSDVYNGAIQTANRLCAPPSISQWDAAAPPVSFLIRTG